MGRKTGNTKENNEKKKHLKNNGSFALAKDGGSKPMNCLAAKLQWAELKKEFCVTQKKRKKKQTSVPWPAFNSCESDNFNV